MASAKQKPATANIDIDIPEDIPLDALAVSHTITLKDGAKDPLKIRVLAEPHDWKLLESRADPIKLVEAYCHPLDWAALGAWFGARRSVGDELASRVLNAMVTPPTGHPTNGSGGSSTS